MSITNDDDDDDDDVNNEEIEEGSVTFTSLTMKKLPTVSTGFRFHGIPLKIIRMTLAMYCGGHCAVFDGGGYIDWQCCVKSGFRFLLVVDWVMRNPLEKGNIGIR